MNKMLILQECKTCADICGSCVSGMIKEQSQRYDRVVSAWDLGSENSAVQLCLLNKGHLKVTKNPLLLIVCTVNFQIHLLAAAQFDLESCDERLGKGRSPACPHLQAARWARLSIGSTNLVLSSGLSGPCCVAAPSSAPRASGAPRETPCRKGFLRYCGKKE